MGDRAEHGTIFDPQLCLVFQNYVDHPDAYGFTDSTLAPLKAALPTASAVAGDPSRDIHAMARVVFVMRGGKRYR